MDLTPDIAILTKARPSLARRVLSRIRPLFVLTVLLPTVLASVYYGMVASDIYISESRFVVRSPQRPAQGGLGALLQGTVFSRSQDDTYSVHDYIRSRDALQELQAKLGYRGMYSSGNIDLLSRFPGVSWDDSFEALHRHYLKNVSVEFDTASSISVLRVRAFTAKDATAVNDLLLQMGERLVNNLNNRSRQDLIQSAEAEVKIAEERSRTAAVALAGFRREGGVYDPDRQSAVQLQGVAKMQEELLATELQAKQLRQLSPSNSQVATLDARVQALRQAMESESAKVVGRGGSLAAKAPAYDRLLVEKSFADRQLAAAFASLESARSEAQRKQLYLERLVQPNLPDVAVEPRRLRSIAGVLAVGIIFWGMMILVIASIREHTD